MASFKINVGVVACAAWLCLSAMLTNLDAGEFGRASFRSAADFGPLPSGYADYDLPRYGSDRLRDYDSFDSDDYRLTPRTLPRGRKFDDGSRYDRSQRIPMRTHYRGEFDLDRLDRSRNRDADFDLNHLYDRDRYDRNDSRFDRNSDWYDHDLPSYSRTTPRRVPNTGPLPPSIPTSPRRNSDELTLDEQITRRYQDERVIRMLTQLTAQSGEAFFLEISQMIDSRHIEPTSYAQRVRSGFEHLATALSNPAFQQATGINPAYGDLQALAGQFAAMARQTNVRTQAEAVSAIRQAAQMAQQAVGLNPGVVYFEMVYASMNTLDKFSMIMPPEVSGNVNTGLSSSMVGIGVEVETHAAGLRILKAFAGGPAAEAILKKGDLITSADGRSLAGMDMDRAVNFVKGQAGTQVRLGLRRSNMVADVTLVRRAVTITSVSEVKMVESGVGYIKLDSFSESTTKELDQALWSLHNSGMESLILDLRGNPGGFLTTAIEVTDRFLPSGVIVSTRGRNAEDNSQETATYGQTWKTPLVVLIDHDSASASEIFAAAIQENGRGLIVGETSYGKGTVQTLFSMKSVTAGLRLTTAKFYSPDGREMANAGVTPDIAVRTGVGDEDALMLQAATEAVRDPRLQNMSEGIAKTGLKVIQVASTLAD